MRIAFYSPIKPPGHPVPSGDRLMARLLIQALELGGAVVDVVSEFRSFRSEPPRDGLAALRAEAAVEEQRIAAAWQRDGAPDLFFTYHPYYKAPDLIGPPLAQRFSIPYLTAEASYSRRRDASGWQEMQAPMRVSVPQAAVNVSLTERDRDGLRGNFPEAKTTLLAPFLDASLYLERASAPRDGRLVTVAMMRPGDKMDSYRMLAAALATVETAPWTLSVIGDGPTRSEVEALFADFGPDRIEWHGQRDARDIAALLSRASLYVWPGCGEAYGLAYLEAQAAGLPVVAQAIAGVPAVVIDDRTGILTPPGDVDAYGQAIATLLADRDQRLRLARGARELVSRERSIEGGSRQLMSIIKAFTGLSA
jgi:glycosyltransferase involved in cell wall biosynthesis